MGILQRVTQYVRGARDPAAAFSRAFIPPCNPLSQEVDNSRTRHRTTAVCDRNPSYLLGLCRSPAQSSGDSQALSTHAASTMPIKKISCFIEGYAFRSLTGCRRTRYSANTEHGVAPLGCVYTGWPGTFDWLTGAGGSCFLLSSVNCERPVPR